jgi:hypothetical protein
MLYNALSPKINYVTNNYLSNLDLINKYNLKTSKNIPNIEKIIIHFPIEAFIKKFYDANKDELDSEIQIKSLFLLYLLFCNLPFINTRKQLKKTKLLKTHENRIALKITLMKKDILNNFLYQLLFESENQIGPLKFFKNVEGASLKENSLICSSIVLMQNFNELNQFVNNISISTNSKEFFFNLKFFFRNTKNLNFNSIKLIKNISPFWGVTSKY